MITTASARLAYTPPIDRPLTICCANSDHVNARATRSVPEVGATDGLVCAQLGARSRERDASGLEHVALVRAVERDVRVLLDDEDRQPVVLVERPEDVEDLADDERRQPERRLVEQQQTRPRDERARERE